MGSLSVSTLRGLVQWQGLLLIVSLLNFWCLPTMAQEDIWLKNAAEGENVHLRILNMPPNVTRLAWYKGRGINRYHIFAFFESFKDRHVRFPKTGRVILNSDGSLLIKKVTKRDAGIYTIGVEMKNSKTLIGYGKLSVYRRVRKPTLRASNTIVTEDKDAVVLTCNSNELTIQWLFNGKELQPTERMKLSQDRRSLTIDPVKREDAGNYQCEASNPISSVTSVALELDVKLE